MNSEWKDYLSFTKKERIGIVSLITLIGISIFAPQFFRSATVPPALRQEMLLVKEAQLKAVLIDSVQEGAFAEKQRVTSHSVKRSVSLFEFDPNTLSVEGWEELGVSARTARIIQNYVSKGGRFRKREDLQKIYGLSQQDYKRLAPYVRIAPADAQRQYPARPNYPARTYVKPAPAIIDINTADTSAWIALPGIGSKLAMRIVNFRSRLGGFYSVDQVGETYGLPDSTFQRIKERLRCLPEAIQKININEADVNVLKQHPYIRWQIANAIIQYRQQHGPYKNVADLQQIAIISTAQYEQIVRYLRVD